MPKLKTKTPTVTVTVANFDDIAPIYRPRREGQPIADFADFGPNDYSPRGNTPLRDATAQFIGHLDGLHAEHPDDTQIALLLDESASMSGNRDSVIAGVNEFVDGMRDVKPDPEAGGKVLAVIFTDGLENASREVSPSGLAALVRAREATGDWTFIYMGANQDAWSVGRASGLSGRATGQSVNYVSTPVGTSSAFAAATSDASEFVADNKAYAHQRANTSLRSLTEDGKETTTNLGAVRKAESYGDVDEALRKAKGENES